MAKNAIDRAFFQVAVQHHQSGRLREAERCYRELLAEQPKNAELLWMLGGLMNQLGRRDEAIKLVKKATDVKPNDANLHYGLGCLFGESNQLERAIECYREALRHNPKLISARLNMGIALRVAGKPLEAIDAYREVIRQDPHHQRAHSYLIMTMHNHPSFSAAAILEECRDWDHRYAEPLKKFREPHANSPEPERRLRIGYLSSDLYYHPVARFMEPLLSAHDRGSVEVFCYANVQKPDDVTRRLRGYDLTWRFITGMKPPDVAQMIRRDGVDILVDLGLHSNDSLIIFAYKPAPLQVSYLGYCSTTGLSTMDYRLSDPHIDPEGNPAADAEAYSEETVRLPETYWCYPRNLPEYPMPPVNALPAGVAGQVTFGSMNNFAKVSEETLSTWAKLLEALPESRLIIHAHAGEHRNRLVRTMRDLGINSRRLEFTPYVRAWDYFQKYQQLDIALDPFPQCGGTTTCDALYMGVPVVTLRGKTAVGRGGVSLLANVGLADLVAENEAEYVEKAVALARDLPRLRDLRATLRQRMEESPLMNPPRFARNIEAAYRTMWRRWCAGRSVPDQPASIDTHTDPAPPAPIVASPPPPAPTKPVLASGGDLPQPRPESAPAAGGAPMISLVICSIDPRRFHNATAMWQSAMGNEPYEIVGIHDAKSMCEGYNRGLAKARGDLVIFCHDDIEVWSGDFVRRLKQHLTRFDGVGVAGTNRLIAPGWIQAGPPHIFGQVAHQFNIAFRIMLYGVTRRVVGGIQAMDGLFLAFRRDVIEKVRWDEERFTGFHCYDTDCTYRAFQAGYKLGVALDLPLMHMSSGEFGGTWQRYAQIFLQKHQATLSNWPQRGFQSAFVDVHSREDGIHMMKTIYESSPE